MKIWPWLGNLADHTFLNKEVVGEDAEQRPEVWSPLPFFKKEVLNNQFFACVSTFRTQNRLKMSKTNRQIFAELSPDSYFKSVKTAAKRFSEIEKFAGSLGFDDESNSFLVLHRGHSPSAFEQEIPACLVLKKLGFRVILDDESSERSTADAWIGHEKFEIKQVAKAQNFKNAVVWQFRNAYKKTNRILLHVAQKVNAEQVRGALFLATQRHPIEIVWVVFEGNLYRFDRKGILKGHHHFGPKK